jgi:hypothetical protein
VVRLARATGVDGVEGSPLQDRLVALDEQEVVSAAVPVVLDAGYLSVVRRSA